MADQFRLMLQATLNKLSERLPISSEWHASTVASVQPPTNNTTAAAVGAPPNITAVTGSVAGGVSNGSGGATGSVDPNSFPHVTHAPLNEHYLVNRPTVTPLVKYSVGDGLKDH